MKSTSSALTPRKIAEFCKGRFTSMFTEGEVRLLYSCLVDLLERNEYPPYRSSGLDLQSLSAMLGIDVDRLRAHRAILQPIFDAVAREVSNVTLRPARTPSRSIRSKATAPSTNFADVSATGLEKVRRKPGVRPRAIVEFPKPLDPSDQEIASVTADGAFDTRKCHDAIAARGAAAIIPPRKNAKPWKPDTPGAIARNEALRTSRRFGRTIWRRWSGYHRRSRVETKMHCVKLLGQRLMARDFDRQVSEFQVRVAVLNGFTALGIPVTEAVG